MDIIGNLDIIISTVKDQIFGLTFDFGLWTFSFFDVLLGFTFLSFATYFINRILK